MVGCCYIPKRYILIGLSHIGFFVVYALRVNLSVALVAMVNSTYAHVHPSKDPECPATQNTTSTNTQDGEFNWDQNQQGLILSSFFYGYLFTQLPGGYLGNKYGGKWVFGIGVLVTSVLTLVTPLAARTNFYLFIAVRVLEGLGEGVTFPAMHAMIAKWAPTDEKSRMVVLSYSGASSGTIVSLPICGILCSSSFLGGWPSAFYVFGGVGLVWFVIWIACVSDSPQQHSTISYAEKKLILDSQKGSVAETQSARVPWSSIFTSVRVWAIIIAHFGHNWIWYLVLTGLPSYFKQVLNFKLTENGFLSALPFIASFLTTIGGGALADFLIRRNFKVGNVRRSLGIVGFYTSAVCLVLSTYAGCDEISLSVACMVLATGLLCMNNSGFNVNHLDISPRYGGVLMGLTNFAGTISGCLAPLATGYFTNDEPTRGQYRKVFFLAAGISVVCGTFFNVFVSGEQQSWNSISMDSEPSSKVHVYANDAIADHINSGVAEPSDMDHLLSDSE